MGNSLVAREGTNLVKRSRELRRSIRRMSTDHQRYSIENQAAVIATYARLRRLTIVETYRDAGLSGLRLKNRTGLTVSLRLARSWQSSSRKTVWTINRRAVLSKGFIAAIRLANGNRNVLDYLFLPTSEMTGTKIHFTAARLNRFEGHLFATPARLAATILRQCNRGGPQSKLTIRSGNASQAMRRQQKRLQTKGCPRG
jgi:hypothetical protein